MQVYFGVDLVKAYDALSLSYTCIVARDAMYTVNCATAQIQQSSKYVFNCTSIFYFTTTWYIHIVHSHKLNHESGCQKVRLLEDVSHESCSHHKQELARHLLQYGSATVDSLPELQMYKTISFIYSGGHNNWYRQCPMANVFVYAQASNLVVRRAIKQSKAIGSVLPCVSYQSVSQQMIHLLNTQFMPYLPPCKEHHVLTCWSR